MLMLGCLAVLVVCWVVLAVMAWTASLKLRTIAGVLLVQLVATAALLYLAIR